MGHSQNAVSTLTSTSCINFLVTYSGSTGNSSGPHVPYETRINGIPVDPLPFSRRNLRTC